MRRTISTMVLLVTAMLPISGYPQTGDGGGIANAFSNALIVTDASVSERVILLYAAKLFPNQSEDAEPIRTEGDVLITYDFRGLDANGNLVAEFTDEVPVDGFGQASIRVTGPTSEDALLVINDMSMQRIPLTNGRFSMRIAGSTRGNGRNPQTGEAIQIRAKRVVKFRVATVDDQTGATRATYSIREVVPEGFVQTFPFPGL